MKEKGNRTRYIYYTIVMILLSLSCMGREIPTSPMSFYIALLFIGENVLISSIMYLISSIAVAPTLIGVVSALVPVVVMSVARFVGDKLHTRMTLLATAICTILSMIPIVVLMAMDSSYLIFGIMNLIMTAIFTYLCIIALFALRVRRMRYRFSSDEIVSLLALLLVMSMGAHNINIYGFNIYYVLLPILVLIMTNTLSLTPSILICTTFGLGGGISSANIELAGIILFMTLFSALFMRYNRWFSIVSILAFDMVGGTYFEVYPVYDYLHLIAIVVGCIIFVLIPRKRLRYMKNMYSHEGRSPALVSFVNRNRIDVVARINYLAGLFHDIEAEMTGNEYIMTGKGAKTYLSQRIMCNTCVGCARRETCFKALGGDTLSEIEPIVSKSMLGTATTDDVSTFLQSRCDKIPTIVSLANEYASKYAKTSIHICDILDNKRILGEQIGGIGRALGTLSNGILEGVSVDTSLEERIREELNVSGVALNDVLVIDRRGHGAEITLVVSNRDKDKRIIRDTLESLLKIHLTRLEDRCCEIEGFSTIRFVPKSQYRLTYGIGCVTKEGSEASGDTRSIVRLDESHIAVVLCDGKGSGTRAGDNSSNTIGIIEKMYKAGFDSDTILSFANNVLSIRNNEDFSALDMCILNMQTATLDFIKLGGVTSFIRRASSVDMIEGSALPLGILEEATPSIERRAVSDSDIVVMVSDGITDSIGTTGVKDILMNSNISNVQKIADEIAICASQHGAIDDVTVIAMRLQKNN